MRFAYRRVVASLLTVDWSRFEGIAALRCTIGVGCALLLGFAFDDPFIGTFGAVGALGAGFGSFQGAYRSRAAVMLLVSVGMALSVFAGSLAGHSIAAAIGVAALWGFGGGLLVALGQAASFVGLQSIIAVMIAGGFPSDLDGAVGRALLALGGGLIQTLLVVMIWPFRRFGAERRSVAAVYRTLASYAAAIPVSPAAPPEPHTLAATRSPLADPQPFASSANVLAFQALLDDAEQIRAGLAAFAVHRQRLVGSDRSCADTISNMCAQALNEIADALVAGREPRGTSGFSRSLADCVASLPIGIIVERLLGQIRSAWRSAGVLTAAREYPGQVRAAVVRKRRWPAVRDALVTLRANLTLRSTACRHALRLATTLSLAVAAARVFEVPRGYWLPMTVALVLKPDFHDTFAFSLARVGGTVLGAVGASAIAYVLVPGPTALFILVLAFAWAVYALTGINYVVYTIFLTGYVVCLLALAGVPETTAATARIINTVSAGALALCAYAAWPTWTVKRVRPAVAEMLEQLSRYLDALLSAYAHPAETDGRALDELRASARLARSNAEAIVERTLSEPNGRLSMSRHTMIGLLAATRRNALAALALHAGLDREPRAEVPGIGTLVQQVTSSLLTLADAVRRESVPPPLPPLRETQLALGTAVHELVRNETDLIVESVEAIGELLVKDAAGASRSA